MCNCFRFLFLNKKNILIISFFMRIHSDLRDLTCMCKNNTGTDMYVQYHLSYRNVFRSILHYCVTAKTFSLTSSLKFSTKKKCLCVVSCLKTCLTMISAYCSLLPNPDLHTCTHTRCSMITACASQWSSPKLLRDASSTSALLED